MCCIFQLCIVKFKTDDEDKKNQINVLLYTVEILEGRLKWIQYEIKELQSTVETKINITNVIKNHFNSSKL